jgi:DNA-binding NtrC family response regulator
LADTHPPSKPQVLIIDDDQLVRDFAVHTIEYGINHKVMTYESGFQAWEFIHTHPHQVDIVIADANIPDMNGLELLERVKKHHPQKKFILLAGDPRIEGEAKQLGADAFISKPFAAGVLFAVVEKFGSKPAPPTDATVTAIESKRNGGNSA